MSDYCSVEQQKALAHKLGLDPDEYDPNDQETVDKFFRTMLNAQMDGKDVYGNLLTKEDFKILKVLTGRG